VLVQYRSTQLITHLERFTNENFISNIGRDRSWQLKNERDARCFETLWTVNVEKARLNHFRDGKYCGTIMHGVKNIHLSIVVSAPLEYIE